jgi:hypothetical protein
MQMVKINGKDFKIATLQLILLVLVSLIFALKVNSQTITGTLGTPVTFNTKTSIATTTTSNNYLTLAYALNATSNTGWTVNVQANSDFSNGTATIAAGFVSLSYASADGGPGGTASRGYQTLSTTSSKSMIISDKSISNRNNDFQQRFNMRVTGGTHLGLGAGTYSTTLTVTLLSSTGAVMASNSNILVEFVVNYSSSCETAVISSYASAQANFTTYAEQMAGKTVTDAVSIQYSPNAATCDEWSLKVRVAGNFTNGGTSVAPQYFSLRFNRVSAGIPTASQIGVSTFPKPLDNVDVALIGGSNATFTAYTFTEHKFDLQIQGGSHLIIPNGAYTGTLIFSLYNSNNVLVSTSTVDVTFNMNSVYNSLTLELQNLANEINLDFNTIANYTNGVSVTKVRGMRVVGYQPYQVMIKTSGLNLVSANNTSIPVAAVNVQATKFTSSSGGISTFTRQLSTVNQVIVTNPMVDNTQQVTEYDLQYYTAPGDSRLSGKSGVFNTSVLFIVVAQ